MLGDQASPIEVLLAAVTSGDDEGAEQAVEALKQAPQSDIPHLKATLEVLSTDSDVDKRWWAVRSLAALDTPDVSGLLIRALGDQHAAVRQCAALGLRLHPTDQAIPSLLALLEDPDPLAASLAADALADLGTAAVPGLLTIVQEGSHRARLEGVRALARIGDPSSIPILISLLNGDSGAIDYWARQGLERMGMAMVFFKPE